MVAPISSRPLQQTVNCWIKQSAMGHLVCIVVGLIRDQSDRGLRLYTPVTDRPRCPNIDRVWDKIFSIVGHNTEVPLCF